MNDTIIFDADITRTPRGSVVVLPIDASARLTSRSTVMVKGVINNKQFHAALEPNGEGSHWLMIDDDMAEELGLALQNTCHIELEQVKEWMEPEVPADLAQALERDDVARERWHDTTTMARWEWVRWMGIVKTEETRAKRPEKIVSMLKSGKRRPCCFNRAMATDPKLARFS